MNITSLKDVGNLLSGLSTDLSNARIGQTGGTAASGSQAGSFQTVWNAQAGKNDSGVQQTPEPDKAKAVPKSEPSDKVTKTADDAKVTTDNPTKTEDSKQTETAVAETPVAETPEKPELTQEELETASEVLATAVIPLVDLIIETLDITPEDLQQIITDLDLTETDLLDPENLGQVLLKAMGEENQLSLLTNEEDFEAYRTITSALDQILKTESPVEEMPVGDLVKLVSEAVAKAEDVVAAEAPEAIPVQQMQQPERKERQDVNLDLRDQKIPQQPEPQNEEREIRQSEAGPLMEADDRTAGNDRITEGKEQSEIRQATTSEGATLGAEAMIRRSRSENNGEKNPEFSGGQHQPGQPVFQNPVEANAPTDLPTASISSFSDAQEIANQILDYMKTQVKEDLTSLEMQLHPASLGTLHINVASKGGILTANFIAQSEQVKAAIENQMVQLREQFEEQGIKVEAIEVTVQTHQFEQSLDQQSEQSEQQQQSQNRRVRRLQLGPEFEEEPEDLDEADRIAKEMMEANGNTVDYTV